MADKILKTRIKLLIRTYEEWIGDHKNDVLLKGEVGFCVIENKNQGNVQTAPTVLFKVGTYDGVNESTKNTFEQLKWASALAADVYDWAKKPEEEFLAYLADEVKKVELTNYYTKTKIDELLASNASVGNTYADGVAATAKSEAIAAAAEDATTKANAAKTAAETFAQGLNDALAARVKDLEDHKDDYIAYADQAEADAIATAAADATAKAGAAESAAKAHAEEKVNALANGAVNANTVAIGEEKTRAEAEESRLAGLIAGNATAINTEKGRAEAEEIRLAGLITALDNTLKAAIENEGEGLDSIKELATWIEEHGEAATEIVSGLNEEIAARQAGDKALGERIDDLTNTHNSDKQAILAAISEGDTATLNSAKSYAEEKANAAETAAKNHANDLNTAMAGRVDALEGNDHNHGNKDVLDGITATKISAWDGAEQNAKDYAKNYADSLAGNYATAAQGAKADTAIQSIVPGTGLKVTPNGTTMGIEIDDEVIFVFDCNF